MSATPPRVPARTELTSPSRNGPNASHPADTRYLWRVLSVTSLGVLLSGTNTSTLDVGLPVVARHFHASATQASWIVLSYMVVNTVLILVLGRVADIVGRRRLYLAGLMTLTIASLFCGFAPNAETLAAMRAVQAVGAAALITNTTALLTDVAPAHLLGRAVGFNVSAAAAAQVAGPSIGGLFASTLGWRWVFWFNVPIGVVGIVWATISLRPDHSRPDREPFDPIGAVLAFTLVGGTVLFLSEGGALGWSSVPVIIGLASAAISLPLFIVSQRLRAYPMLDLSLLADRARSIAYLAAFLLAVARFAVVLLIALYLQAASGTDPLQAGVRVIPVAAGLALTSPIAGRFLTRYPARWVASAGMGLTALALVLLAVVISPHAAYPEVAMCLLAVGIGTGLFMAPNTTAIMTTVLPSRRGIANGLRSMLQNSGYVVSTALTLAIVTSPLSPIEKRSAYAGTLSTLSPHSLLAFTHGYRVAFVVLAGACVVGMLASLTRPSHGRDVPHLPVSALDTLSSD